MLLTVLLPNVTCFCTLFFICQFSLVEAKIHHNVYVFGDSHAFYSFRLKSEFSWPKIEHFKIDLYPQTNTVFWYHLFPLAAKTMHSIGRDGLNVLNLKNFLVKDGSTAVFMFGEIDVRCHILKQRDTKRRMLKEIIEKLTLSYYRTIKKNKKNFHSLNCVVVSVIPPSNIQFNPDFPWWGSLQERIKVTQMLNKRLEMEADRQGVLFLNIYDAYASSRGDLIAQRSDGMVHIAPLHNSIIRTKLTDLLLKNNIILDD